MGKNDTIKLKAGEYEIIKETITETEHVVIIYDMVHNTNRTLIKIDQD